MRIGSVVPVMALCLAGACGPYVVNTPAPVPDPGSAIRYSTPADTTEFVQGRLVSLDADSLAYERLVPNLRTSWSEWKPAAIATDSISTLQVRIGRRNNAGRGARIGAIIGIAGGLLCASGWDQYSGASAGECLILAPLSWAATGALIGLISHSDVWAPTELPPRPTEEPPGAAPVTLR